MQGKKSETNHYRLELGDHLINFILQGSLSFFYLVEEDGKLPFYHFTLSFILKKKKLKTIFCRFLINDAN